MVKILPAVMLLKKWVALVQTFMLNYNKHISQCILWMWMRDCVSWSVRISFALMSRCNEGIYWPRYHWVRSTRQRRTIPACSLIWFHKQPLIFRAARETKCVSQWVTVISQRAKDANPADEQRHKRQSKENTGSCMQTKTNPLLCVPYKGCGLTRLLKFTSYLLLFTHYYLKTVSN